MAHQAIEIASGELQLEGRLHDGGRAMGAVVLHPHPQYGGDMHNHVVVACCEAFAAMGATALRLNFRGTGRSEGTYDNGRGEADDARSALAVMRGRLPEAPILLVGYSFGAMIAAAVADGALSGLVLISPPIAVAPLAELPPSVGVLVVTGDRDVVSSASTLAGLEADNVQTRVFEGVDHGWWPGIDELVDTLAAFARGFVGGR